MDKVLMTQLLIEKMKERLFIERFSCSIVYWVLLILDF